MRIIYYFNPDDSLQAKVDSILKMYDKYDLIKVYSSDFANLKKRYLLPEDKLPHLVSINNTTLEAVWNLTNGQ